MDWLMKYTQKGLSRERKEGRRVLADSTLNWNMRQRGMNESLNSAIDGPSADITLK